jgi:hypothetical protein
MILILYTGGAAGNLVAAIIDSSQFVFNKWHFEFIDNSPLAKWKFGCPTWQTTADKCQDLDIMDLDFNSVSKNYKSLASHQHNFHITRKHEFILIDSSSLQSAQWCVDRFRKNTNLPSSHAVFELERKIKISKNLALHTNKIIKLEDIINGKLIEIMKQWTDLPLNDELYKMWLDANV